MMIAPAMMTMTTMMIMPTSMAGFLSACEVAHLPLLDEGRGQKFRLKFVAFQFFIWFDKKGLNLTGIRVTILRVIAAIFPVGFIFGGGQDDQRTAHA
jgi:hypothetical protein